MDREERNVWLGITLVSLVVTLLFPGGAAAQGPYPIEFNRTSLSDSVSYWTAARMASAVPAPIVVAGTPTTPVSAPVPSGPAGAAGGSVPGGPVNPGPGLMPNINNTTPVPSAGPVPLDGGNPGPNDTFEYGPKYRTYPVSTVGKLFFTEPGVGDFVCSAAVTTGGTPQNIIWTAGHCVANGGHATFYTNWLFCPSYDSGQGGPNPAVGCWSWSFATTSGEWFNNGAFTRDYAIIGLVNCGTVICKDVATVTGGLGFAWNWARDQHWRHLGYPQASPYTGGKIIETDSEHRFDDTPDSFGPPTNSWGSAQTGGSSGSSLIKGFTYCPGCGQPSGNPFGNDWINSHVSYGYTGQPNELYGPYFDTQVCNFWKGNTGYTGTC